MRVVSPELRNLSSKTSPMEGRAELPGRHGASAPRCLRDEMKHVSRDIDGLLIDPYDERNAKALYRSTSTFEELQRRGISGKTPQAY
jgi:hypothetical protein